MNIPNTNTIQKMNKQKNEYKQTKRIESKMMVTRGYGGIRSMVFKGTTL